MIKKIQSFGLHRPYLFLLLATGVLFSIMAFQGVGFSYVSDYAVYVSVAQNFFHGGVPYKDAIDVKSTGFLFLFTWLFYTPYALWFPTLEFLHIWHAFLLTFWYAGLAWLIYTILASKPLQYSRSLALFAALAFLLFNLGNRHSLFFNQPQASLMFVLLLALVFVRTWEVQRLRHHALYGFLIGLCFLCSSPYALLALMVPAAALRRFLEEKSFPKLLLRGLSALGGFLAALLPFAWYFASNGALNNWWFWNYTYTTTYYDSFASMYMLTGLQILPLLFLPFWSKTRHPMRRSLLAYFSCFLVPILIIALLMPGIFLGEGFNQDTFLAAQASDNWALKLLTNPIDLPFKAWFSKPLVVLLSFFTGNEYLIFHTPPTLYHYFLLLSVLIASVAALIGRSFPPFPLLVLGVLSFLTRLTLARGRGSDSWNLYLTPLVILWLPFLMETFHKTIFPKIQRIIMGAAVGTALVYIPIWSLVSPERLSTYVYSPQLKAIVQANPSKAPETLVFPWGCSYSTRWNVVYYNQSMGYTSTYEEALAKHPEALLIKKLPDFNSPRSVSGYRQVTFDIYWLFIREDALPSWQIPDFSKDTAP